MTSLAGQTLAHYRITAAIGAGGMGEVYRATDTKLRREVALKVLPAAMAASPERVDRFRREVKALAALDHPGIVTVHSVEEVDGVHFLTMRLVEGQPLDRLVPEGGLTASQILEIATGLAEALPAAPPSSSASWGGVSPGPVERRRRVVSSRSFGAAGRRRRRRSPRPVSWRSLGEADSAFEVLTRAEQQRQLLQPFLICIGFQGSERITNDRRLQALLARMGLPDHLARFDQKLRTASSSDS
jgi:hypothetical protein